MNSVCVETGQSSERSLLVMFPETYLTTSNNIHNFIIQLLLDFGVQRQIVEQKSDG